MLFIAMPAAASESGNGAIFGLLCFTCWISGVDSAVGFIESAVTNIIDATGISRPKATLMTCATGLILSTLFTTNWGWVLFDMVDHFISSYIVMAVALCQCVAVGWIFERRQTSARSPNHKKSMRALAIIYWFPVLTISVYASFFNLSALKDAGIIAIVVCTLIGCVVSYILSQLTFAEWYHEIMMCGVDKLSMSITSLSNNGSDARSFWMIPFEAYFGIFTKFVNPPFFCFFLMENLV